VREVCYLQRLYRDARSTEHKTHIYFCVLHARYLNEQGTMRSHKNSYIRLVCAFRFLLSF